MMSSCNVCFIVALERVDAATVLLLQSLAPWSAALLAWGILREPVDRHTGMTMILATAGVAIMGTDWGTADAIGLGAAVTIALLLGSYAVVIRASHPSHKDPTTALPQPSAPVMAATEQTDTSATRLGSLSGATEAVEGALLLAGCTALWGLIFAPVACASAAPHTVFIATKDALLGTSAGGLCLGIGLPLYSAAGKFIPAARTNLLLLSEILLAPTWTWLVHGEEYGARTLVGGALLLAALAWLALHPSDDDHGFSRARQQRQQQQKEEDEEEEEVEDKEDANETASLSEMRP
jgi:drug/metabolite transporter (DMT)-like permease